MNFILFNDGINVCVFLLVVVVDIIFMLDKGDEFFICLVEFVEQIIWFLFEKINVYCDFVKNYDVMVVYRILWNLYFVMFLYELYEELFFVYGVYFFVGREKLYFKL